MHKPISIQSLKEKKNNSLAHCEHLSHLEMHNQSTGTSTLYLINKTLQHQKNSTELSGIQIQQLYRKWQQTMEYSESNTQILTALKTTMSSWIELQSGKEISPITRNTKAEQLLKHIQSTITIFNLSTNTTATTILHYIMLHPVHGLSPSLMQKQADIYYSIKKKYHALNHKPNYQKISNLLLLKTSHASFSIKKDTCFIIGMTVGFIFATILKYNLLECSI
ncbi:MAG: hypothetical protein VX737_04960 [Pseudomonadota bacterium]|nr:hypothetical protein [Pseudomonadota bacterium]